MAKRKGRKARRGKDRGTAGQGEGDLLVGLAFEECLKDLCGGDGVEAFGRIFPRKLGGSELFPGAEAAQSLILKVDGDTKAPGQAGGKAADELGLGTLGVVHIQREPKDDGVNALGGDDIGDFLKEVLLAPDYGKRGCNRLIAVADCQPGALGSIVYSKVSHIKKLEIRSTKS
jgi:hypothetical protein